MDSPKTLTDVVNLSLMLLGETTVSGIESSTASGIACRRMLPQTMRRVQSAFRWAELVNLWKPDEPFEELSDDGLYQFQIPPFCLRLLEELNEYPYRVEHGVLITLTNMPVLRYLRYSEAVDKWSAELVECVRYSLAIEVAPTLTNGGKKKLALREEYEKLVKPQMRWAASAGTAGVTYRQRFHGWNRARYRRS